jgi:hypothetical protein
MERTLYGRNMSVLLRSTEVRLPPFVMRTYGYLAGDLSRSVESDAQIGERK